jgi:uncharacterized BrkB/YihY/UPF0761 family membrane protein
MFQRLAALLGPETSEFIKDAVAVIGHTSRGGSLLGSLVSFFALLAAASGSFFQLKNALNKIWRVPPPQRGQTGAFIRQRLFSFGHAGNHPHRSQN